MGRVTVAGAGLIAVSYGLARFALGLFVPELRATFALSAREVGWIMAASFAGYLAALLIVGGIVARVGARAVAVASGIVATTGLLGVASATGPLVLGLAATIGGLSTGLASPSLATAVEQQLTPSERSSAQTIVNAGTSLGLIVAAPAALVAAANWRAAWLAFVVLALLATLAAVRLLPADAHSPRPLARPQGSARLGWPLRTTAVLLGISSAAFWAFGRELLEVVSGLPAHASRTAWIAVGLGGLFGAATGTAADRVGLRLAMAGSWVVFAATHLWLAVGSSASIVALAVTAGFGAGYMALTGLLIVWSVRERPDRPGAAVATSFLLLAAGQIIGSPMAGLTADLVGLPATFALASLLAVGGLVALPRRAVSASPIPPQSITDPPATSAPAIGHPAHQPRQRLQRCAEGDSPDVAATQIDELARDKDRPAPP